MRDRLCNGQRREAAGRQVGNRERDTSRRRRGATESMVERFERLCAILMFVRKLGKAATLRRAPALLARIREERNRRLRADQDHLLDARQRLDDLLGEVGQALDVYAAGTQFAVRCERVRQQSGPGLRCDPAGGLEARAAQRSTAQQDHGLPAIAQQLDAFLDRIRGRGMRANGG